jgi:hypothetical protein
MLVRAAVRWVGLIPLLSVTCAGSEPPVVTLHFEAADDEFPNPERGFYRFRDLTNPANYAQVRAQGETLIYGRVLASDFRDRPLTESFLDEIQAGFDEARRHGIKVKFRLTYNDGFEPDAPKSIILGHIQQLAPLWEKNKDVMFHMDAGFIGAWGEWHSSTNGLDNNSDRRDILLAILDALPQDRTVGIRTPHFKREIFTGSPRSDTQVITRENAFDGSPLSRVGHVNDCFLSSPNDVGTYINPGGEWPLRRELTYIGGESRFVPFGGETCGLDDRNLSAPALVEMETLHIDYLNLDYHPDVIRRWEADGSFAEIQRRLGYRFELDSAKLPVAARPGGVMPLEFTIRNVGFGELFNPRRVEVTLRNSSSGELWTAPLAVDPRRWTGGETNSVVTHLSMPETLPEGIYSVGLRLPDMEASLRDDVRYSIRFANVGVWHEENGENELMKQFVVSRTASGSVYSGVTQFAEVFDLDSLKLKGDFDGSGSLGAEDIDTLGSVVRQGTHDASYDLTNDGVVTSQDRAAWIELIQRLEGDTDLDGAVDFADFIALASAFEASGGWRQGDFDGSGRVELADFVLLANSYGKSFGRSFDQSVPTILVAEPAVDVLLPGAALACFFSFAASRKRRHPRSHHPRRHHAPHDARHAERDDYLG